MKNKFMTKKLLMILLTAFLSEFAQASTVTIADHRCVNAPVDQVVKAVTDYSHYSQIPEATLSMLGMTIMKMTKSQEIRKDANRSDDSIVYIELRPLNFGDDKKDLFPRFFIRCKVTEFAGSAHHECHSLTSADLADYGRPGNAPAPFGLAHFDSDLQIDGVSSACGAGQSQITYNLAMEPNDSDVNKILSSSGLGALSLPQDQFFKAYYQNFYNGWVKTIQ